LKNILMFIVTIVLTIIILTLFRSRSDGAEMVTVSNAWARASAGMAHNGAAYFSIQNGHRADKLIGISTPIAKRAEIHSHTMTGGVMRMREVKGGIALKPGVQFTFQPGGHHAMLVGLAAPLKAGAHFPLTLVFEHAGKIPLTVLVRSLRHVPAPSSDMPKKMGRGMAPAH
jgi:periplasmic copper chaperone A